MNYETLLKWAACIFAGAAWLALVLMKLTPVEPFISFLQATLLGLGVHGLTISGTTPVVPKVTVLPPPYTNVPPKEGGFAIPWFLIMLFLFALSISFVLEGCTTTGMFDNRVACAVAKDKAFFVSEYGPVGVAATIADQDRKVICP